MNACILRTEDVFASQKLTPDDARKQVFARFNLSGHVWKNKSLVKWYVKETPDMVRNGISLFDMVYDCAAAFKEWRRWSTVRFRPLPEANEEDADIVIQMADVPPKTTGWTSWKAGVLAVGHYPIESIGRIAGDIYVNSKDFVWRSWQKIKERAENFKSGWYDFFSMVLHEIGHTLGIAHSEDSKAVMAPFYKRVPKPYILAQDDKNAIIAAYGKNTNWSQRLQDRITRNKLDLK